MSDLSPEPTLDDLNPTFVVGSNEYASKLKEDLFVNRNDLSEAFAQHAERFAWYATCYELSQDKLARLEAELKRAYAVLDHEARGTLAMSGVKTTEKMVENTVITDPRYIELQEEVFAAQKQVGLLKAARDAMIHRRDMLISMGATYRAEVRSDPSLKGAEITGRH